MAWTYILNAGTVAGDGLSVSAQGVLSVNVDDSSIEIDTDTLQVKALGITDGMLAGSISNSKLATDPLARANHTGTQTASTISDFYSFGANLGIKAPVRVATTAPGTLTTSFENGDTIDGVVLATGNRILIKDQSTGADNGIYCADSDTTILTRSGWKHYQTLEVGEDVLTLNIDTGQSEWQPVQSVHSFDVIDTPMLSIESRRGHSSFTTLNHRWPVLRWIDRGAKGRERVRTIRESHELTWSDCIIRAAACSNLPDEPIYSNEFVELVAWFITEGHIRKNNSGSLSSCVRIVQSEKVNHDNVDRIRNCLFVEFGGETAVMRRPRAGNWEPEWRERPNANGNDLTSFDLNREAGSLLCEVAPNRVATEEFIVSLTSAQLQLFVDTAVRLGDGHVSKSGHTSIVQKDRERLIPIQMACALMGVAANIYHIPSANQWGMTLYRGARGQVCYQAKAKKREVKHTGIVWCPRTANGTWFASREGSVYFTGNTVNATGSPTRATDADGNPEVVAGMVVFASEGTENADQGFVLTTNDPITVGSTSLAFTQFTGGDVVAGDGLTKTDNTLDVNVDDSSIEIDTDTLQVKAAGITDGMLAGSISNSKLATNPLARANHTGTQTASTISDFDTQVRTNRLDQMAAPTADVSFNSNKITNLTDPAADQDAATKAYVDSLAQGLDVKASVVVNSTDTSTSGTGYSYAATGGTSGRGQITWSTGPTTVDGVTLANDDRILNSEADAAGGIWVRTGQNTWDRATDFDEDDEVSAGAFVFIEEGTSYADSGWVLTTNDPITIGGGSGTSLSWAQFSGAGQVVAGDGLSKNGNTLDVNVDDSSIEIDTDTLQVKAAGITDGMLSSTFLKANGTQALTADWDAGAFEIRAQTFESDVATGTAPFVIASTTAVTNLNADMVDGIHASSLIDRSNHTGTQTASTISDFDTQVQTTEPRELASNTALWTINFSTFEKFSTVAGLPVAAAAYRMAVVDDDGASNGLYIDL